MDYKNLEEFKALSAQREAARKAKDTFRSMTLSTLFHYLYTNADFRLDLLADKLIKVFPDRTKNQFIYEMKIVDIAAILLNTFQDKRPNVSPYVDYKTVHHEEFDNCLAIMFELIFLPLYIAKDN